MKVPTSLCVMLLLAGCNTTGSPPPPGSVRALFWDGDTNSLYAARADASCRAIGLTETSPSWSDCMIEMMAAEKRRHDAAISRNHSRSTGLSPVPSNDQGKAFLCKDAIMRGDQGAIFIFC